MVAKAAGTSHFDFNYSTVNQALSTVYAAKHDDGSELLIQFRAVTDAMIDIKPRDAIEGMIAAQMVGLHNAAMECLGRASLPNRTMEARAMDLGQVNKLTRSYATLVEALNRHRGKGQQKVTVEHVHVHEDGQAIVGNVEQAPGGQKRKSNRQPHER